jgi:hypothetical protein
MSARKIFLQNAPRPSEYPTLAQWAEAVSQHIDEVTAALKELTEADSPVKQPYAVANLTPARSLDCDAVTLPELADVVGTLINDFKTKGQLRGKA